MTAADFFALSSACDALLLDLSARPERVAIPWLHVLSEHPNNLGLYKQLFRLPSLFETTAGYLRKTAGVAKVLGKALLNSDTDPIETLSGFPAKIDVVFISHLVSAKTDLEALDFYFGSLPDQIAARGMSSLVALHDHLPNRESVLKARLSKGGVVGRIVMPHSSAFKREGDLVRRASQAASALRRHALSSRTTFQKKVALEAARHAVAGSTIASLRLHDTVLRLCARFRPRTLIVTWEGHAWERMAFHAAREIDPSVKCVGYQHAVLFPHSHALKRSLGRDYDPDLILTIGDITRDVLRRADGLKGIPIHTYGSHRRVSAVARRAPDASARCLVIPEGLEAECLALFEFAIAAASRLQGLHFVLRTHPVLPFDRLVRRHSFLRTLPANVSVSDQADIAADFVRCDWALYRGSSAALHALLAGVRPLYLRCPDEMPFDPLFALTCWRQHVSSFEELEQWVVADRAARLEERQKEWEPARAFCDRYAAAPDPDRVFELLTGLSQ